MRPDARRGRTFALRCTDRELSALHYLAEVSGAPSTAEFLRLLVGEFARDLVAEDAAAQQPVSPLRDDLAERRRARKRQKAARRANR